MGVEGGGIEEEPLSDTGKCELPQPSSYPVFPGIVPVIEGPPGGENIMEATDPRISSFP